jgi:hypothetical protein
MLVRAYSVGKHVDLRLIRPAKRAVRDDRGTYLLVNEKKLIVRHSNDSTVAERAKIAQLSHEIVAGKQLGHLSSGGKPELANEDGLVDAAFWRALERDGDEALLMDNLAEIYPKSFAFYQITRDEEPKRLDCDAIRMDVLDSEKVAFINSK